MRTWRCGFLGYCLSKLLMLLFYNFDNKMLTYDYRYGRLIDDNRDTIGYS
jgi:hypothetical protein